ncbi:UDP-glucose 4-epimerase GalE [Variovorax sp. VNK109]|uniref:UDP-glucose 4-epimerase GalE n=1 Tax=Variovorax sp. VNK109 TaxID=3400919 RepID=UPI003BFB05FF
MILVTGGAGFIGSHVCAELLGAGRTVAVFDDFSHSTPAAIDRIAAVAGRRPAVFRGDVRDAAALSDAIERTSATSVIHLAGMKSVPKSFLMPGEFHDANVRGVQTLLDVTRRSGVRRIIFSSSATVYAPATGPVGEDAALAPCSPYGQSKLQAERLLQGAAVDGMAVAILRYFNASGAHESGALGDAFTPQGDDVVSSLLRARSLGIPFRVHGMAFGTRDGTAERDYVHVQDLAGLHVRVTDWLGDRPGLHIFNAGSGRGSTVLEALRMFEQACGQTLPWVCADPRPGDLASYVADMGRCARELQWSAFRGLAAVMNDALRWHATKGKAAAPVR